MPAQRMRSVIPPYMLRRIIEHGNAPQRDCALLTLNHVQSLLGNKPLRSPTEKNARAGEALRDIYDAQNGTQLPGKQVRKEGQPSNHDVTVDEAYDYLGVTYDFFWQAYRRNSLDNQGCRWSAAYITARSTKTPSGTASRWCSATATARSSTVSPSPSTWSATSWRTA